MFKSKPKATSSPGRAHARYCGPIEALRGEWAILRLGKLPGDFLAQFDNLELDRTYTHAWIETNEHEWEMTLSQLVEFKRGVAA